ncbi:MAG: hypothetical protein IT210_14710 [Armatimonadetes bacterium]|nr:hypothetical protein [Armatimonadota bacterium]
MRYALGLDGGGSKCDAVLIDETGQVIGWGRGGPTHGLYDTPDVVTGSTVQAIEGALGHLREAEIWVGGGLHDERVRAAVEQSGRVAGIASAHEVSTAFASVQQEWGLIILSGTGAFVHGRTPEGKDFHMDGLGPVLGDYGSAHAVGLRGLRAAFASGWAKSRRTALADTVPQALGAANLREVFHQVYIEKTMSRRRIASLARLVDREAEGGDGIARKCLLDAADELSDLAVDLVREMEMAALAFPMIAIGSVAQNSRLWWGRVCERLHAAAPACQPVVPRVRPVVGAALQALREMGIPWTPELLDRIVETQRPFLD